jgi:scyllo-inositol 2-dehydrogenase (NADP+)
VTGYFHKLVWHDVTNEDQGRAVIRFANGAVADLQLSCISMVGKPRWRILGTQGGITDGAKDTLKVMTLVQGRQAEITVPFKPTKWEEYYVNIADHLLRGKPLAVKPEESLRDIAVIEAAELSAKAKKPVKPAVA